MSDNSSAAEMNTETTGEVAETADDVSLLEPGTPPVPANDVGPIIPAAVEKSGAINPAPERRARAQIQTVRLDSRDFRASWPTAIASLEQLSGWAVLALRLGTLALIQQCVRELAEQDARADLIVRLRTLTDALAHMPLET